MIENFFPGKMASESVFYHHQQRLGNEEKRFVILFFPSTKAKKIYRARARTRMCGGGCCFSCLSSGPEAREPQEKKTSKKHLNNDETRVFLDTPSCDSSDSSDSRLKQQLHSPDLLTHSLILLCRRSCNFVFVALDNSWLSLLHLFIRSIKSLVKR